MHATYNMNHDDVIKWKHFPRYWPFVREIHRSPVNSPHKGQRRGALMFSLSCGWINGWVNNCEAGDLRRHRAHCDVIVMWILGTMEYIFQNANTRMYSNNSTCKYLSQYKSIFEYYVFMVYPTIIHKAISAGNSEIKFYYCPFIVWYMRIQICSYVFIVHICVTKLSHHRFR